MISVLSAIGAFWLLFLLIAFRKVIVQFFKGTSKQIKELETKLEKENNE